MPSKARSPGRALGCSLAYWYAKRAVEDEALGEVGASPMKSLFQAQPQPRGPRRPGQLAPGEGREAESEMKALLSSTTCFGGVAPLPCTQCVYALKRELLVYCIHSFLLVSQLARILNRVGSWWKIYTLWNWRGWLSAHACGGLGQKKGQKHQGLGPPQLAVLPQPQVLNAGGSHWFRRLRRLRLPKSLKPQGSLSRLAPLATGRARVLLDTGWPTSTACTRSTNVILICGNFIPKNPLRVQKTGGGGLGPLEGGAHNTSGKNWKQAGQLECVEGPGALRWS